MVFYRLAWSSHDSYFGETLSSVVLGKGLVFYILWGWIRRVNLVGDFLSFCSLSCTLYESTDK